MTEITRAGHFDSLERQAEASRLFLWVFLASETLLFTALFSLYAGYRALHPAAFSIGIEHGLKLAGSLNTAILLVSSFCVATAVHRLEQGHARSALAFVGATVFLGFVFLGIKTFEYHDHLKAGFYPGSGGDVHEPGLAIFFALYYFLTGAHALHVMVGIGVLLWLGRRLHRGDFTPATSHPLELGALYWHLVDLVWIVLWPLFYLTSAAGGR